ncbi:unnamed protein product [Adineta steineri]|uniref:Methyltransferase FkbM domain-containing protein n=1 Tax=Adineta steineri TaxID=433720 RepID=A0A814XU99_9BILA|nr:unnamed protein product [Adineta steineri]CAF3675551.1 unnamed protein product [Adineta steineri]
MSITFITLNVVIINKIISNHLSELWQLIRWSQSMSQSTYPNEKICCLTSILTQANKFQQLLSKDDVWSACYRNDYLSMIYLADLNKSLQQKKLLFDIGANKGYTIALWLSMWMPEIGVNPRSLYMYLSQVLKIDDCGVCTDCNETISNSVPINNRISTTLEIHAFEPMESTYQALRQVSTWINISTLYIHEIAISNTTGIANMKKCPVGSELCGLLAIDHSTSNEKVFQTSTITLDEFVEQKNIQQKIDLLKIDTEGADPLVLQGAKKLFAKKQIRILIFENHGIGTWKTTSLLTVIEFLSKEGFICYMLGKTGLARLTNCWSPAFDIKRWSNVLCVHREEEHVRHFLDQLLITNI